MAGGWRLSGRGVAGREVRLRATRRRGKATKFISGQLKIRALRFGMRKSAAAMETAIKICASHHLLEWHRLRPRRIRGPWRERKICASHHPLEWHSDMFGIA